MAARDYELEFLIELHGQEFEFGGGYRVKFEAQRVKATPGRPHGIKYSLTLHDPAGKRLYGLDNAHKAARKREFDHRHVYGGKRIVGYAWRGPAALLNDFYREVERILSKRGVSWS